MNLFKYMAFIRTVERGSFTRAAEDLKYSQSGISRMIADLEKEWNVTLLERSRAGVRLTSEGTQLLPLAQSVCRAYEALQMQIDALNSLDTGLIRIGTFSSVATHWLPNIIREFQRDYPNLDYELLLGDYTEIETWIETGRVDCGFLRLPSCPKFACVFLERDPLFAVVPNGHPFAEAERVSLGELCHDPFLLLEKGGSAEIAALFEQAHLSPRIRFRTWDDYAIMSMVESGLGVSILPGLILRRIPYRIVTKPLDVPAFRDIGFVLRSHDEASLAVKRFMEYLEYRNAVPPHQTT